MSHPLSSVSSRRLPPFPGAQLRRSSAYSGRPKTSPFENTNGSGEDLTAELTKSYLSSHPAVLDDYILEFVTLERIELWMNQKQDKAPMALPAFKGPAFINRYLSPNILHSQHETLSDIYEKKDMIPMLSDMANIVCRSIHGQSFTLYIPRSGKQELCVCILPETPDGKYALKAFCPINEGTTVAAYVAKTSQSLLVKDIIGDERFPNGTGIEGSMNHSVICAPVITPSDDILCIMEFTRDINCEPFGDTELQTVNTFIAWMGIGIYQSQVNKTLMTQADLNDFLLDITKIIFDDVIAMDRLVEKIMMYTKDLVNADRCSLFLVDEEKKELYANFFDEGKFIDGKPVFEKRDEIRFPMDRGIAGSVALSGQIVNIPDAYADQRFNRDIDKQTGYTTRNILCMPIISKGKVIGVVQMINKKEEMGFTNADVSSFRMFAVYCALALHYSKMYRDVLLQTAHNRVAIEQLTYHSLCNEQEVNQFMKKPRLENIPPNIERCDFYVDSQLEPVSPKLFVEMAYRLDPNHGFDLRKLYRFVLTVKKNYRVVPYHNWKHGWSVAHGIYSIFTMIQPRNFMDPLKAIAFLVAALCHDVDHRGYNNAFLQKFHEPLATLYETSTMERHHYAVTVRMLQAEGHNIFSHLSPDDYRRTLGYIRHAILATDLAIYMRNIGPLSKLIMAGNFSLDNDEHKDQVFSLMMTAADLMVVCKPWIVQKKFTAILYEEFYNQGDFEKLLGSQPVPMMDRDMDEAMPRNQVGFMKFVCMPCYTNLGNIFPELKCIEDACRENMEQWQCVVEGRSTTVWEPAKSRTCTQQL